MTTEPVSGDSTVPPEIPPDLQALNARLGYLEAIKREYDVTIRVVAVLTQQLLAVTGGEMVVIRDDALEASPDITAWREEALAQVVITVAP